MKQLFPLIMACALAFTPAMAAEKKEAEAKALPYNGKIVSVDAAGQAFTLSGPKARVMHVAESTTIKNGEAEAKFSDLQAGQDVKGSATKSADDTWTAKSVIVGAPKATKAKAEKKS